MDVESLRLISDFVENSEDADPDLLNLFPSTANQSGYTENQIMYLEAFFEEQSYDYDNFPEELADIEADVAEYQEFIGDLEFVFVFDPGNKSMSVYCNQGLLYEISRENMMENNPDPGKAAEEFEEECIQYLG